VTDSDSDDWDRLLSGDSAALGQLFARHAPRLFRHAARLVSVREDAKDAVVIAFYELWRKRSSVRLVDGSPLPWLLNTTANSARNLERSSRRYRKLLENIERPSNWVADVAPPEESSVSEALDKLTARERSVVVLTLLEGYSERETAHALGIPVGTVKSRLARAKERLRNELTPVQEA
jgi:RNA polymerase sigma factor (sigma-70 family)